MAKREIIASVVAISIVLLLGLFCLGSIWVFGWTDFGMIGQGMPGLQGGCFGGFNWILICLLPLSLLGFLVFIGLIIWLLRNGKSAK